MYICIYIYICICIYIYTCFPHNPDFSGSVSMMFAIIQSTVLQLPGGGCLCQRADGPMRQQCATRWTW